MVYQWKAFCFSYKKIATNLGVDITMAWRIKQFERTGMVSKKQYHRDNLPRKVNHTIKLVLCVVLEHPSLDETKSDRHNALRKYGYSLWGIPAVSCKLLVRGQHLSTIACISIEGISECETVESTVDGDTYEFVSYCHFLCPKNHHSIVVMDNASVHHINGTFELINGAGALLIYLPPYSPDYNPIEEAFSKVKTCIKTYEELEHGPQETLFCWHLHKLLLPIIIHTL